jgi:hypothetical protein
VRFPCRHAVATTPVRQTGSGVALTRPSVSAFPVLTSESARTSRLSRFAQRSLALRPARSRGHQSVTVIRGLQTFCRLHACPGCFRLERLPGGPCTRWKSAALSRRTSNFRVHAVGSEIRLESRPQRGARFSRPSHCASNQWHWMHHLALHKGDETQTGGCSPTLARQRRAAQFPRRAIASNSNFSVTPQLLATAAMSCSSSTT